MILLRITYAEETNQNRKLQGWMANKLFAEISFWYGIKEIQKIQSHILRNPDILHHSKKWKKGKSTRHMEAERNIQSWESLNWEKIKPLPLKFPTPVAFCKTSRHPNPISWWCGNDQQRPRFLATSSWPSILLKTRMYISVQQPAATSVGTSPAFSISATVLFRSWVNATLLMQSWAGGGW